MKDHHAPKDEAGRQEGYEVAKKAAKRVPTKAKTGTRTKTAKRAKAKRATPKAKVRKRTARVAAVIREKAQQGLDAARGGLERATHLLEELRAKTTRR